MLIVYLKGIKGVNQRAVDTATSRIIERALILSARRRFFSLFNHD